MTEVLPVATLPTTSTLAMPPLGDAEKEEGDAAEDEGEAAAEPADCSTAQHSSQTAAQALVRLCRREDESERTMTMTNWPATNDRGSRAVLRRVRTEASTTGDAEQLVGRYVMSCRGPCKTDRRSAGRAGEEGCRSRDESEVDEGGSRATKGRTTAGPPYLSNMRCTLQLQTTAGTNARHTPTSR